MNPIDKKASVRAWEQTKTVKVCAQKYKISDKADEESQQIQPKFQRRTKAPTTLGIENDYYDICCCDLTDPVESKN